MCNLGTDAVWSGNPVRTLVGERMTGIDPYRTVDRDTKSRYSQHAKSSSNPSGFEIFRERRDNPVRMQDGNYI
jgi:hypothetical protein